MIEAEEDTKQFLKRAKEKSSNRSTGLAGLLGLE